MEDWGPVDPEMDVENMDISEICKKIYQNV